MAGKIQTGYLVSYDYELLKTSLPTVYIESDQIFIAIDKNRNTWNGGSFSIDDSFFEWIKAFDVDNKVVIYEDDFYVPELTTMQCEIRERKMLAEKMGIGNWIVQVDCDEYFVDFKKFVANLRRYDSFLIHPEKNPIQVCAFWVMLYKYTANGILYVDKPMNAIFATNFPNYKGGRRIKGRKIYTDSIVLHESLARTEEELRFKLDNWGHNQEIDKGFLSKWLAVDENNYNDFKDFYYLNPKKSKKLNFFPNKSIPQIKEIIEKEKRLGVSKWYINYENFLQWLKYLLKKTIK
ncbi:hypothetical protein [Flavobacterium succinicans]|uniref:Glycosyl transferase family 2 n=1 Tax=Flavobacterium succinicans TaxID=29536 RepID=A0A199XRG3_9FLAO|nr:hypothetical protein [Flavobacterium succinicans]OAZ04353.1 hypothetical protein FLB_13480 [Flavobacterium succinicans]